MSDPAPSPPPPRPFYRQRDFWVGFVGWYFVNGVIWFLIWWWITSAGQYSSNMVYGFLFNYIMLPVNLIVLLIAAIKRLRVAGGMLAAIAFNLLISLLIGATLNGTCGIPFFIR